MANKKRKRRELKNNFRYNDSSDMLFIGIPLIVTMALCAMLVLGTFRRFDAAIVQYQNVSTEISEETEDASSTDLDSDSDSDE